MNRRSFLSTVAAGMAAPALALAGEFTGRIYKAVKVTMIRGNMPLLDRFKIAQDAGFDGISLFAPDRFDLREALAAQDKTGVRIHNVNGSYHWKERLTDTNADVRKKAVQNLMDSIQFSADCGGDSVLLVIGKVTHPETENYEQVRERSMAGIREAIPLAARLGVRILCENVGNGFCPDATEWKAYLDKLNNPFVGAFFDIGNHHGLGGAPHWIRTLDQQVVKIDIKDRNLQTDRNCNLFDGHVSWEDVREALKDIRFNGWATAEVGGGDAARIKQVAQRMDKALGL